MAETLEQKIDRLLAQREAVSWFDRKGLLLFALGAVASFGGSWVGINVQLAGMDARLDGNTREIQRVEKDDKERDADQDRRLDKAMGDHMTYQHGGKRMLGPAKSATPPLLEAGAQPAPGLAPPLPVDVPPCCAGLPYALGGG